MNSNADSAVSAATTVLRARFKQTTRVKHDKAPDI